MRRDKAPSIPLPRESILNLTSEQVAAAEAAGCRFIPVPPEGLHRYAMQRKLFRLDGREMLATCGGGLYETASTLDRLIEIGRGRLPTVPVRPLAPPMSSPAKDTPVASVAQALSSHAGPQDGASKHTAADPIPASTPVTADADPIPAPVAACADPPPTPETAAPTLVADDPAPSLEAVDPLPAPEAATKPAPRRRTRTARAPAPVAEEGVVPDADAVSDSTPRPGSRARKPAGAARWATAGAERRGRTDQHWSKRTR